ncbi:MAG: hypothetical protein M3Q81_00630 [bacterium]|nr:hypothetical protein [bacterium]
MNDTQPPTPAATGGNQPQKSPLDILEEILKENQAQPQPDAGTTNPAPAEATLPAAEPAGPSAAEQEALVEAQMQENSVADKAAFDQKLAELHQATQDSSTEVSTTSSESSAEPGFEIKQLSHTKIAE